MRIIDDHAAPNLWKKLHLAEISAARRKSRVFLDRLTVPKLANAARSLAAYLAKRPHWVRFPVHLKIDVAPLCQLRCPVCVHAARPQQVSTATPKLMKAVDFRRIVDQVSGRSMVLSLYNLGEPLLNPDLSNMIAYASEKNLNTYLTSNFSLPLKPETLESLVRSGLTMLLVAVDGVTPDTFGRERVRGNLSMILANLRAVVAERKRQGRTRPIISLQYIVFDFNMHEKPLAIEVARNLGVDELHFVRGDTVKWTETARPRTGFSPRPPALLPRCAWPYFSTLIHSNGDVAACCKYRIEDIYKDEGKILSLGNMSSQSVAEIYTNETYREARKMSIDPQKAGQSTNHFCSGCGSLYLDG